MRKPTEISANDDYMLIPLKKHKCDGSHEHSQIACNQELTTAAKYTMKLCVVFVDAIVRLKASRGNASHLYLASSSMAVCPSVATSPDDRTTAVREAPPPTAGRAPVGGRGCLGCYKNYRTNSPSRDRDPYR